MKNTRIVFAAIAALVWATGSACGAGTTVINFNGLPGGDGTPFPGYKEAGFTLIPRKASAWLNGQGYGHPAPFIYFTTQAGEYKAGSIYVRHNGAGFSFVSVDLYSSVTTIPYILKGTLKGATVFIARGIVPNTLGDFKTVRNRHAAGLIDTLEITLFNGTGCCENPMGLDNITLSP